MADSASKKAFPLRISNKLFEQIRTWAEQDLRSINGQIEYLLADAVRRHKRAGSSNDEPNRPASPDAQI